MTQTPGNGGDEPVDARVEAFSDITEVTLKGPAGSGGTVKARATPERLTKLILSAVLLLLGAAGFIALLAAGRSFRVSAGAAGVILLLAAAVWFGRTPKRLRAHRTRGR